ncbi:flagellar FlbD family protein [Geomonas sp. Red69]|uniref:flagellar FlbD family protein n=1 Tax=Geomonas diazotrophica TaxID=2843197 RepID=UPI001C11263B|nr:MULTISPECIES: flagellar FlbD family protein [Geomonas]MBU5638042.1 flagellar FlbD family protein [Geomonas diazotrophica]QXE86216.1 flagellar FlbD family protein [Geomonas nitrogeniifigens]
MIKVTTRDGTEMYLNPDLIEIITETPDTHITLSNGNRYLVLEPARVVISRIVNFKAHLFRQASFSVPRRYLRKGDAEGYYPNCRI